MHYSGCVVNPKDPRVLPHFMTLPPFRAFWNSHVAVGLFFILSGFVLPLNYFKKVRNNGANSHDSITSGTFRRYFRLMIPLTTAYSIYYFVKNANLLGPDTFSGINEKRFIDIFKDGIFKTWFGYNEWMGASWTMEFELIGSYFVYLLS